MTEPWTFDVNVSLVLEQGTWDYIAFKPYVSLMEAFHGEIWDVTIPVPGEVACLLWAQCVQTAVEVLKCGDCRPADPENDELLCKTLCGAFEVYVSEQKSTLKGPLPKLCCQSRRSIFLKSITPDALLDDEHFSIAAISFSGGWLLVDGGPRCRRDVNILISVLEGDEGDLDFLRRIDTELLRGNPEVLDLYPHVLDFLPEMKKDVALAKALMTLDYRLLRLVDNSLLEDRAILTEALLALSREHPEQEGFLKDARDVLGRRSVNSRTKRLIAQLPYRLMEGNWEELFGLVQKLAGQGGNPLRCDSSKTGKVVEPLREAVEPMKRDPIYTPSPEVALLETEIRKANEEARAAKQREKLLRKPQRKGPRRKPCQEKGSEGAEGAEAPCSGVVAPVAPAPSCPEPLMISWRELEVIEPTSPCKSKGQRKQQKRAKLLEVKAEERRKVAEIFGIA